MTYLVVRPQGLQEPSSVSMETQWAGAPLWVLDLFWWFLCLLMGKEIFDSVTQGLDVW